MNIDGKKYYVRMSVVTPKKGDPVQHRTVYDYKP